MSYPDFFQRLTGYGAYDFQRRIGGLLLGGQSVVFRAPTGAGKTWTTVAPFLYSLQRGNRLADRLIYALPLRALATSLHASVVEKAGVERCVCLGAKDRSYTSGGVYCSLQMGGETNDPFFEGDLIFCTIDQVLSGYLMMPLSLPARLDNIVAGALVGSLLILDEAHLLESKIALGTVIEMLDRLKGLVQFVFMTATMSDGGMQWLAKKLGATVPKISPAEIRELPVQQTKRKVWRWRCDLLNADEIRQVHRGGRTLAIVNQTQRAQDLYGELVEQCRGTATKLACLHSRFLREDRRAIEATIQPWFGKSATETDVILVTTQVVEAGMDVSADHILTEVAPMNALVQRAGRTARYVDRCAGTISVYEVQSEMPYKDDAEELTRTRECLVALGDDGEIVDFEREQAWVEHVHGPAYSKALDSYDSLYDRRQRVEEAIRSGNRSGLADLVRKIDSVNILLSGDPGSVEFERDRWPTLLSVPRSALRRLENSVSACNCCVWRAEEIEDDSGPMRFRWSAVESAKEFKGCWLIAVGPTAASYSPKVGLRLGTAGDPVPVQYGSNTPMPRYRYCYETWVDHVRRVMEQAAAMDSANGLGAARLEAQQMWRAGVVSELVQVTAAFHDVGKLAVDWQERAWEYETFKTKRKREQPIAHTTKGHGDSGPRLPPHAVEGAYAAAELLFEEHGEAAWAIASAIARHHSSRAKQCQAFELIRKAGQQVGQLRMIATLRSGDVRSSVADFENQIEVSWEDCDRPLWPLYAYLARRLRLADQAGTASGVREGGSTR